VKLIRNLAVAAMAVTLAACAAQPAGSDSVNAYKSAPDSFQAAVAAADWNSASVIEITLRDDHFAPMLLKLKMGKPYVLRFTSKEPKTHLVAGSGFLGNMAVASLSGNDTVSKGSIVHGIALKPWEPREIKVIPMVRGRFEFRRTGSGVIVTHSGVSEPFALFKTGAYGIAYVE